jgi:hexosaminidase
MKKLLAVAGLFGCLAAFSQNASSLSIIPEPVSVKTGAGTFTLPQNIVVKAPLHTEMKTALGILQERMAVATGSTVTINNAAADPTINMVLNDQEDKQLGKEGYKLSVTAKNISISANQPAGLYYGVQTLMQLFPKEIESLQPITTGIAWTAPVVDITDYPRFGWRGLMFDVSRHFFTKADVKKYIDNMVRYKYNVLHLHLTDDEGWRIEIKGLPKLTEVGAWRVKKTGYFGTFEKPKPNEPKDYGGFYTQDDIREIVQYAKERFVNILPEIDVPGHSLAAVVSYPELSCTPEANTYSVRSGEEIMDWSKGHPPIALVDNTLCPANEKVYEFLDKVMTQVAQLFPFEYIHVGGDECPKNYWAKNPQVKALMQREGLKTMDEVQAYFEKRLEKIVVSKGKKFMGWNEIMQGGLAPSAAVMSWLSIQSGVEAANMKHDVVMTPTAFTYIDYMQGDEIVEPRIYSSLRLNKAYEFEPVPAGADANYIKGGQANLWTEQVYNMRHAEYMTWPRGLAIAESVWSPKEKKNWDRFFPKVEAHFKRLDMAEIKYAPSVYDPGFKARWTAGKELQIEMDKEVKDLDLYYTFDNSFPDRFYPKYTGPVIAPKEAVMLKVISYKGKQPVGRMITVPLSEMKKRADIAERAKKAAAGDH